METTLKNNNTKLLSLSVKQTVRFSKQGMNLLYLNLIRLLVWKIECNLLRIFAELYNKILATLSSCSYFRMRLFPGRVCIFPLVTALKKDEELSLVHWLLYPNSLSISPLRSKDGYLGGTIIHESLWIWDEFKRRSAEAFRSSVHIRVQSSTSCSWGISKH